MTTYTDGDTRRRVAEMLGELDIPVGASTAETVACAAAFRQRPIDILTGPEVVAAGSVCGLVLTLDDRDVIIVGDDGTQHERVTVAHELGHLLFDHAQDRSIDPVAAAGIFTGIDPSTVLRARRSSCYSSPEEYEAEFFARMLIATPGRRVRGKDSVAERMFGSF